MTDAVTISSDLLFRAILHGAARTREKKDDLNRINVFPVVDNDTGNNLAHTMHAILKNAQSRGSVRATLRDIARSALIGARGNSGAIFSQYFNGLYQQSAETESLTLAELAACFQEAYDKAFKALESPVEGTVITLMRAWATSFREALDERRPMHDLFETALIRIRQALDETSHTLKALKALGIVDAGALGYYYFMDGFVQVILGIQNFVHQRDAVPDLPAVLEDIHPVGADHEIPFRYCTEVLLELTDPADDRLREALKTLGDCLLISSADNLARIHLHTNEPATMVSLAAASGQILENKCDDMVLQNLLAGPAEPTIACVTDSIADLPQDFVRQNNIFQIPINILVDGVSYLDKLTIGSEFLHAHIASASTAQLNTEQIQAYLLPILRHYRQVLVLTVSSAMSGTHSRFQAALAELGEDAARVALIDTKVNSGAQGLLVREAVQLIAAGLSLGQIVQAIEARRSQAKIVVSVLDIAPMARSGRVSEKIGDLLIKLQFKPLITISPTGKGTIKGLAFTVSQNRRLLLKSLRGKPIDDYVIVHAAAPERAEAVSQDMRRITGHAPLFITEISSAVTLFAGQGSVAVAYLEKTAGVR